MAGDLVAVAAVPAPASELPRQHGARVAFDAGARRLRGRRRRPHARPSAPGVFACGDVTGYAGHSRRRGAPARPRGQAPWRPRWRGAGAGRAGCAPALARVRVRGARDAAGRDAEARPRQARRPPSSRRRSRRRRPRRPRAVADARTGSRRAILDAAWSTVRDKHYDKTLGGVDWNAVRAKYEPLALGAPSDAAVLPRAQPDDRRARPVAHADRRPGRRGRRRRRAARRPGEGPAERRPAAPAAAHRPVSGRRSAIPGLTVRVIEGRPTITRVRAGSSADRAGLAPGLHRHADRGPPAGRAAATRRGRCARSRSASPSAARAQRRLLGPPGTRVSIALPRRSRPAGQRGAGARSAARAGRCTSATCRRCTPRCAPTRSATSASSPSTSSCCSRSLEEIKQAMARFVAHRVRAVVLDLRGNPGGQGAMAIPVGVAVRHRAGDAGDAAVPRLQPDADGAARDGGGAVHRAAGDPDRRGERVGGRDPRGRPAGSRSAPIVVGDTTLGAVLPSVIEALPGGAVMQYVVADFKTPKGVAAGGARRAARPARRRDARGAARRAATRCSTRRWWR